jgi:uncharacterized protein YjdB
MIKKKKGKGKKKNFILKNLEMELGVFGLVLVGAFALAMSSGITILSRSLVKTATIYKATGITMALDGWVGNSKLYKVTVLPSYTTNKVITCASSNTSIATVQVAYSTSGYYCQVKPLKAGTVNIVARTTDGSNKTITKTIVIGGKIAGMTITNMGIIDNVKGINGYRVNVTPANALNQTISCTSSNTTVATTKTTVAWSGTNKEIKYTYCDVTPLKNGIVTITARATDGSGKYVTATKTFNIKATTIQLKEYSMSNSTRSMEILVSPSTTLNKNVTCTSSNNAVATTYVRNNQTKTTAPGVIFSSCDIKPIKAGTVTITARTTDGTLLSSSKTMTFTSLATGISMTDVGSGTNGSKSFKVIVSPNTTINKNISCVSSNPLVATTRVINNVVTVGDFVNSYSYCDVTPVSNGTVTITAKTTDGSVKSAARTFISEVKATSISMTQTGWTLDGDGQLLRVTVGSSLTKNKTFTCISSNPLIAEVEVTGYTNDQHCGIIPLKAGTVTITAKTADGTNLTTSKTFTFGGLVTGLTMTDNGTTADGRKSWKVVASPTNALNQHITCTSSNTAIATV